MNPLSGKRAEVEGTQLGFPEPPVEEPQEIQNARRMLERAEEAYEKSANGTGGWDLKGAREEMVTAQARLDKLLRKGDPRVAGWDDTIISLVAQSKNPNMTEYDGVPVKVIKGEYVRRGLNAQAIR